MLDSIYEWIRNIAYYFIFITIIMHVLPNSKYNKYIKFFTGLLLIILVMTPVLDVLGKGIDLENIFKLESYKSQYESMVVAGESLQDLQSDYLMEAYKKEIEAQISDIVEGYGLTARSVTISLYYNEEEEVQEILGVDITAGLDDGTGIVIDEVLIGSDTDEDSIEEINIKNDIQEVYNIPSSNINISIQR